MNKKMELKSVAFDQARSDQSGPIKQTFLAVTMRMEFTNLTDHHR